MSCNPDEEEIMAWCAWRFKIGWKGKCQEVGFRLSILDEIELYPRLGSKLSINLSQMIYSSILDLSMILVCFS